MSLLSIVAIVVAPYLKTKTPPDSSMVKFVVSNLGVLAAVPVVFWFNVGNVQFAKLPEVGVPKIGVTKVGVLANTSAPVPVSSVTAAAKLALDGVPRNVATPVPKEVMPVPPLATAKVPASVIAPEVDEAGVSPVVPALNEVTPAEIAPI